MQVLSLGQARRVALAAHGFADPMPSGCPYRRHLRRVLRRTMLLQMDSVNVFERAHYLPAFSRLGPYDKTVLGRMAYGRDRELFEHWGHEVSLLPVSLHPLLRWRMARAASGAEAWGSVQRIAKDHPNFVATVLGEVRHRGTVSAGSLAGERLRAVGGGGLAVHRERLTANRWDTTGPRRRSRWVAPLAPRSSPPNWDQVHETCRAHRGALRHFERSRP